MKIEVTDVVIYLDKNGKPTNWPCISAKINGIQHITGDVRKNFYHHEFSDDKDLETLCAVFSDITKASQDPSIHNTHLWDSIQGCVECSVYTTKELTSIHSLGTYQYDYVWVNTKDAHSN